ncbi:MAG: 16S rRNA (guanine(527)-N(7))-methyltransferase RsmG [Burkholderiaceae bacterium]|jgi:16S rRNA (guanine527-N7)-methyltransferase
MKISAAVLKSLDAGLAVLKIELSSVQLRQLHDYLALLLQWNATYNLTAIREPQQMVQLHLLDSLAILPVLMRLTGGSAARILDVGAGAGLPGIVLAIVRPEWHVDLIDTVQKKAAFMRQATAQLRLSNSTVIHGRVEALETNEQSAYDLLVSRAFSDLASFIQVAGFLLKPGGCLVAMKGRLATESNAVLPSGWCVDNIHRLSIPGLAAERHLIVAKRIAAL